MEKYQTLNYYIKKKKKKKITKKKKKKRLCKKILAIFAKNFATKNFAK